MTARRAKRIRQRRTEPSKDLDKTVYLTTTQFAKAANVTPTTVRQAIETGRIEAVMDGQWWRINVKTELEKFIGTLTRRNVNARHGGNGKVDDEGINSTNAALMERVFKAKKAELEYKRLNEELIPVETVTMEWQSIAQGLLSGLLSIPDRVAPMLEGMGHREIHSLLVKEIKHACQELSDSVRPEE
jgi:excisionase family DNA binding protein